MEEKLTFVDEVQVLCIYEFTSHHCRRMHLYDLILFCFSVLCINILVIVEERMQSYDLILLCVSVLSWKSRSSKVMARQLMLCWSMVCSMKEIK